MLLETVPGIWLLWIVNTETKRDYLLYRLQGLDPNNTKVEVVCAKDLQKTTRGMKPYNKVIIQDYLEIDEEIMGSVIVPMCSCKDTIITV